MLKKSTLLETLQPSGQLRITIRRADGTVERHLVKNRVLAFGRDFIANRMIGDDVAVVSHMGVGSGTTPVDDEDLTLQAEIERVAVTASRAGNVVTYTADFPPNVGTGDLTEAGLFNAAAGGGMTCRSVFGLKTKEPGDHITINWDNEIKPEA